MLKKNYCFKKYNAIKSLKNDNLLKYIMNMKQILSKIMTK